MAAPLSVYARALLRVDTHFFHIQTSDLMIKKDETQHVDDSIPIKVTVVLTEITGVLYKRSKRWSLHQSL